MTRHQAMRKKALIISISSALFITACVSTDIQNGQNNTSSSFINFERLNKTAIYYRTGYIKNIPTGEDYWKEKMQQANNQFDDALISVEMDLEQDLNRLSSIDNDMDALVRCRITQRDVIKKQFSVGKLTEQQAQKSWNTWSNVIRQDYKTTQYLADVLENTKKIEQTYQVATAAIVSTLPPVTPDMQQQWQQQLQTEKSKAIINAEKSYKKSVAKKYTKPKIKTALAMQHQQKIAEINQHYALEETEIKRIAIPDAKIEKFEIPELKQKMLELDQQYTIKQAEIKGIEVEQADLKQSEIKALKQKMTELDQQHSLKQEEIKAIEVKQAEIKQLNATKLKQKLAELDQQYALQKAEIKKIDVKPTDIKKAQLKMLAPKVQKVKLLVASIHEKYESIQKNTDKLGKLVMESSNDKGFEQITSQLPVLFANLDMSYFALANPNSRNPRNVELNTDVIN
jgi:hypothetical protein